MRRQTYCAVERPEKQIQCFSDESTGASVTSSAISTSSFELKDVDSSVIFLGIVSTDPTEDNSDDGFDLLVIHKDGHTRRLAQDLSAQKWCILPSTTSPTEFEVQAAFLVDFEDAQKSLLRRRQDIIASILGADPSAESTNTSVLLLITHPTQSTSVRPGDVQVQLYAIPAVDRVDTFSSQTQRMRHLMTMKLAELEGQGDLTLLNPKWDFHSSSATLSLSFGRGVINYDLSQYAPSISSHLIIENEEFRSLMRISPRSVVGAGQSSIAIYDTQYQSVRANIVLKASDFADLPNSGDQIPSITFVTYFFKLGIAVALCGNTLFVFDVASSNAPRRTSLKRPRDGLLINAIGRGTRSTGAQQVDIVKSKKKLDALAKSGDSVAFDGLMKSELVRPAKPEGVTEPSETATSNDLPSRDDFVDPEKIFYLLSKIFSFRRRDETMAGKQRDSSSALPQLTISMLPQETFNWLLSSGRLTVDNIEIALRRSAQPEVLPNLPAGALVQAVKEFDPALKLLLRVLDSPAELSSDELTHALRIFLEVALSNSSNSGGANALTNTPHDTIQASEAQPTSSSTFNEAMETLLSASFSPLNLTLAKLHAQPLQNVTRSLRTVLSSSETILIIHHLRHALAMGGYTSRFTEKVPHTQSDGENPTTKPPTLSFSTIIDLLSACVDAVGPTGWISATPTTTLNLEPDNVIADMKSEISAALAGVEEASYLKGLLREFIRCAGTGSETTPTQQQQREAEKQQQKRGVKHEKLNGAELLIYPTGTAMDIDHEDGDENSNNNNNSNNNLSSAVDARMLPLSLKMSHPQDSTNVSTANDDGSIISKTKVRKSTGEVLKRSSREIGYLKRKAVGKYSFERIIV